MTNMVNKPSHYIGVNGMEVEEVLENFLPKIKDGYVAHRVGSAIEYLLRHPEKNGDEDILKAGQNIKQIADYNERKKIEPEDLQQESDGQKIIKVIEGSIEGTVNGNEMNEFLKALAKTQDETDWVNYFVPNEVNTYQGGTNEND